MICFYSFVPFLEIVWKFIWSVTKQEFEECLETLISVGKTSRFETMTLPSIVITEKTLYLFTNKETQEIRIWWLKTKCQTEVQSQVLIKSFSSGASWTGANRDMSICSSFLFQKPFANKDAASCMEGAACRGNASKLTSGLFVCVLVSLSTEVKYDLVWMETPCKSLMRITVVTQQSDDGLRVGALLITYQEA